MAYDGSEFQELDDVPIQQIARDEVFRASVNTQNLWKQILDDYGWRNDGEAINDITIDPQAEGAESYTVGGDVVQLLIAEYGRRPGAAMPPHEPIADWVHEQSSMPNKGEITTMNFGDGPQEVSFDSFVFIVRRSIAENGIRAIGAGREAFRRESENAKQRVEKRFGEETGG